VGSEVKIILRGVDEGERWEVGLTDSVFGSWFGHPFTSLVSTGCG
jgi:hypothetical protein